MRSVWFLILFGSLITFHYCFTTVSGEEITKGAGEAKPSFDQCKPYVDAALKGEGGAEATSASTSPAGGGGGDGSKEESDEDGINTEEETDAAANDTKEEDDDDNDSKQSDEQAAAADDDNDSKEAGEAGKEQDDDSKEDSKQDDDDDSKEVEGQANDDSKEDTSAADDSNEAQPADDSNEANDTNEADTNSTETAAADDSKEDDNSKEDNNDDSKEDKNDDSKEDNNDDSKEDKNDDSKEDNNDSKEDDDKSTEAQPEAAAASSGKTSGPDGDSGEDSKEEDERDAKSSGDNVAKPADQPDSDESQEQEEVKEDQATATKAAVTSESAPAADDADNSAEDSKENDDSSERVERETYTPRSRENMERILALDQSGAAQELSGLVDKATQGTLKELKVIYEGAIKPLETTYKYRDLSNRHFGDPEIFSKPMVVFMGPWSGGKSTIINWLLGIEQEDVALRTGADPSPAQFNIMIHGSEDEVLDGTQLAADWTFSGLQKFGQAFLDRLRGRKLPNRLLEKVNLVEIPGILEVRKQVERSFPFNDACQWFIDRADILFLVYDPAKLDIGPETEAILDQLKGRENQVRIVLNKADSVKPDELLRLQANLIWNISPLMASAEPPTLYVASLWGRPLNPDSPTSLLQAYENNFLKDIRDATEKRVETRIAAARRFAVRVRNHAKMCDCYLNTYNNHRSFFSNKKKISDDIIENPQNYHIYEGLATLRNISRYDLPDPDTYKDFFRLNPLWEFPTLASTCTYFRGCPINKLDIAIAYDLPELLGRYRRQREAILTSQNPKTK